LKYQILKNDTITHKHPKKGLPVKLYRIIALETFSVQGHTIREQEIGGYIQSEKNLDQYDNSWVSQFGKVYDNVILKDSFVGHDAQVFENAQITNSKITGKVRVWGTAKITNSELKNNVDVFDDAELTNCIMDNWTVACKGARILTTEMYGGSRISNSYVERSVLNDQAEVKTGSHVVGCHLSGRTVISKQKIENQTLSEQIELNVYTNAAN
jgi:ADP-glucose pyrophosphorylase